MALSNTVFTPGQAPDHSAALTQIALNRPDLYKSFSQGYDEAQKRQLALQQYREAKVKADLAEALYPQQTQLQQAILAAKLGMVANPTNYQVQPSPVSPINTSAPPKRVSVTAQDGTTVTTTPSDPGSPPKVYHEDNPFNAPSTPLFQSGPPTAPVQSNPMIPGVADASQDDGSAVAGSPFSSSDFGA